MVGYDTIKPYTFDSSMTGCVASNGYGWECTGIWNWHNARVRLCAGFFIAKIVRKEEEVAWKQAGTGCSLSAAYFFYEREIKYDKCKRL